jgi:hypothetical protein
MPKCWKNARHEAWIDGRKERNGFMEEGREGGREEGRRYA